MEVFRVEVAPGAGGVRSEIPELEDWQQARVLIRSNPLLGSIMVRLVKTEGMPPITAWTGMLYLFGTKECVEWPQARNIPPEP